MDGVGFGQRLFAILLRKASKPQKSAVSNVVMPRAAAIPATESEPVGREARQMPSSRYGEERAQRFGCLEREFLREEMPAFDRPAAHIVSPPAP